MKKDAKTDKRYYKSKKRESGNAPQDREFHGIKVTARSGERPESLVNRFNKIVEKSGIIKEIRKREYYEKPSAKRRRQTLQWRKQIEREKKIRDRQEQSGVL